jgi:hypothetical protein
MERIRGPVQGYFLASYACRVGELGQEFVGYTKLCSKRPRNFWEAAGTITFGTTRFHSAPDAMDNSEEIALSSIEHSR